jgi:hypothetical protein
VLVGEKEGFEVVLVGRDDLLHEEEVAVDVEGQEEDGEEVVDVGLEVLLRFGPFLLLLVELL